MCPIFPEVSSYENIHGYYVPCITITKMTLGWGLTGLGRKGQWDFWHHPALHSNSQHLLA
jgi:hypothetical protein